MFVLLASLERLRLWQRVIGRLLCHRDPIFLIPHFDGRAGIISLQLLLSLLIVTSRRELK